MTDQKIGFLTNFGAFGVPPHAVVAKINGFGVPFWVKNRVKSENGGFVKIVLPLWWEHSFQGSDLSKIEPGAEKVGPERAPETIFVHFP